MDMIFDCVWLSTHSWQQLYLSEIYPSLYLENSLNSSKLKEKKDLQKKKRANEEKKTSTPLLSVKI